MLSAVLVGPAGAGATSVGALLAQRWGGTLADCEQELLRRYDEQPSDQLIRLGEAAFRAREDAVASALLESDVSVVVLGGGAALGPSAARAIVRQQRPVVLLSVGAGTAARRLGFDTARAALPINPRVMLRTLLEERLPRYRELAGHEVLTDVLAIDEVADAVHTWCARRDGVEPKHT